MFSRISVMAAAASFSLLAACSSGPQSAQFGSATTPATPALSPDKDCGGVHGVKVTPCPVLLTRHTKGGIIVTVSGPNVVNSYLGNINGCFSGKLCYNVEREGSSEVQWRITSGEYCGGADVEFIGVDQTGGKVGYFFLRVSNRFCR